jgi:triacylglycerol esterase/lipase EstA (alpha/beta hydrolase family)
MVMLGAALLGWVATGPAGGAESGPALTEPPAALTASLQCSPDVTGAVRDPVLLVPGTGSGPNEFTWNWVRALTAAHAPFCTVSLLQHGLADIQASAEYVVHAIRTMHAMSGRKIAIVGHSQGGMIPRWALRYWPDTRPMVDDLVGIAASNHGTPDADVMCAAPCAPGIWQQRAAARFVAALNAGAETWAGISYTSIYSHTDEVVVPNLDSTGSTSLHTGAGAIANIAIQDVCPLALTEHIGLGTYDPVAYAIALDALDHDGPADRSRVTTSVCTELLMPGANPATYVTDYAATIADLATNLATASTVAAEPGLRCYVTDSCPAPTKAGVAGASVEATRSTAPPAPTTARAAGTLAATGDDLDSRIALAVALAALALALTSAVRRSAG